MKSKRDHEAALLQAGTKASAVKEEAHAERTGSDKIISALREEVTTLREELTTLRKEQSTVHREADTEISRLRLRIAQLIAANPSAVQPDPALAATSRIGSDQGTGFVDLGVQQEDSRLRALIRQNREEKRRLEDATAARRTSGSKAPLGPR